jgi:hypothetical protein
MTSENLTDLSYWFPILQGTGVAVPKTEIVETDLDLTMLLDGKHLDGFDRFIADLEAAGEKIGYPAFFRTGQGSGKHLWTQTCFLKEPSDIPAHVFNLIEWSECVDFFGLPYQTWVMREFLQLRSNFIAFDDMPINRERRYFIKDGAVICSHPYWPKFAIEGHTADPLWEEKLDGLNTSSTSETLTLHKLATTVAQAFKGGWSLDFAQDMQGNWWAIDMAPAFRSFHWPGCPSANSENWVEKEPQ